MTADLERYVPRLAEIRAQERQNRALAFAGLTHTVCGREVLPLTPGHRLNLQLLQNAFATAGADATHVDVFVFLWVVSPQNVGGIEAARAQYFLKQDVAKMDLRGAVDDISRYLLDQLQDVSNGSSSEGRDNSAWIHWVAQEAAFYITIHGGFTLEQYMATPFAVLQQLFRAWKVNNPDMERTSDGKVLVRDPMFQNASDRLVRKWHRQQRDAAVRIIKAQKERRN